MPSRLSVIPPRHAKVRKGARQLLCGLAVGLLAACSALEDQPENVGQVGFVQGFLGGVAADEPRAVLVGREILSSGGTAADAVTAMYFTMSVTFPSAASLGGGGTCLYWDSEEASVEAIDFLPRIPATIPASASRPTAVPMNVRGFYLLQAKYGQLRWEQLVIPAENLARFGSQVSRALSRQLDPVAGAFISDAAARRIFADENGRSLQEGAFYEQLDLAAVLSEIRSTGPVSFYNGPLARRLVSAYQSAGGSLSIEDLRNSWPAFTDTVETTASFQTAHFPLPPAAGGVVGAQMWAMLDEMDFDSADEDERAHMLAEAAARAYGDRSRWMAEDGSTAAEPASLVTEDHIEGLLQGFDEDRKQPAATLASPPKATRETPSATGFVAVDRLGNAAACTVTMNNQFGVGRVAPQTGIVMAALPGVNGRGPMSLGPILVVNHNSNDVFFAGAASGGVTAPVALMNLAARTVLGDENLSEEITRGRVHHGGAPDTTFHEPDVPQDVLDGLRARGHSLAPTRTLGKVNAIHCASGLADIPDLCITVNDPRGFGLSGSAD